MEKRYDTIIQYAWCEYHGKRAYQSRKDAKRVVADMRPRRKGMREYRCEGGVMEGFWHVGTLPFIVRRGTATEEEWWNKYGHKQEPNRLVRISRKKSDQ
jgi:hypothetical protein